MAAKKGEQSILNSALSAATIAVGFMSGGADTVIGTILSGIGVNLASNEVGQAWSRIARDIVSNRDGAPENELRTLLGAACLVAVEQLEKRWKAPSEYESKSAADKADDEAFWLQLKEGVAAAFSADYGIWNNELSEATLLVSATGAEWGERFEDYTNEYFATDFPLQRDYINKQFIPELKLWFWDALKTDYPDSNRAWRSFQLQLWGIIRQDIQGIRGDLIERLDQWKLQVEAKPAEERDIQGDEQLQIVVDQISEAVMRFSHEAEQSRSEIILTFREGQADLLSRLQEVVVRQSDIQQQIRGLSFSSPSLKTDIFQMTDYLLKDEVRQRIEAVFVESTGYDHLVNVMTKPDVYWLLGPFGIGKKTTVIAWAIRRRMQVYCFERKQVDWKTIHDAAQEQQLRSALMLFPEALDSDDLSDAQISTQFTYLKRVAALGNYVVGTSTDEIALTEGGRTWTIEDLFASAHVVTLDSSGYGYSAKAEMFRRHVEHTFKSDSDGNRQLLALLSSARASGTTAVAIRRFQQELADWLPIDIDRFIIRYQHLRKQSSPQEKTPTREMGATDLRRLIGEGSSVVDLDVHEWFQDLGTTYRCFALAVALFPGMEARFVWTKYERVVEELRVKYEPSLPKKSLADLYEETKGFIVLSTAAEPGLESVRFRDPRVLSAVAREIATRHFMYLEPVLPLFTEWIPDPPKGAPIQERHLAETQREGVARFVGEILRLRHKIPEDKFKLIKSELVDEWATKTPQGWYAITAAIALQHVIGDPDAESTVTTIVKEWGTGSGNSARKWASAAALWRIYQAAKVKSLSHLCDWSVGRINKLSRDDDPKIMRAAVYAMKMLARKAGVQEFSESLTRIVSRPDQNDQWTELRQLIAGVVNDAMGHSPNGRERAYALLNTWMNAEQDGAVWTALYTLVTNKSHDASKSIMLIKALQQNRSTIVLFNVIRCAYKTSEQTERLLREDAAPAHETVRQMVLADSIRPLLVRGLVDLSETQEHASAVTDLLQYIGNDPDRRGNAVKNYFEAEVNHRRSVDEDLESLQANTALLEQALINASSSAVNHRQELEKIRQKHRNPTADIAGVGIVSFFLSLLGLYMGFQLFTVVVSFLSLLLIAGAVTMLRSAITTAQLRAQKAQVEDAENRCKEVEQKLQQLHSEIEKKQQERITIPVSISEAHTYQTAAEPGHMGTFQLH